MSNGFFNELRRRRVLPVAGACIAIAWLVTGIAGFYPNPDPPPTLLAALSVHR